jgi:hypothetical protein
MRHEKALRTASATAGTPTPPTDFSGRWKNQYQSTMDLEVSGSDVSGSYTSASSGAGGPITGRLKGFVSGDLISFIVKWPGGSMTAWVGQMVDDQTAPKIKTLWHMVTNLKDDDESELLWMSVFTGADEFHR